MSDLKRALEAETEGKRLRHVIKRLEQLRAENARLRGALDLAVGMIMLHEPGDSRAVSDEAVALASVVCDCTNDETWSIIDVGRARLNDTANDGAPRHQGHNEFQFTAPAPKTTP
jgi:hypothetical protein